MTRLDEDVTDLGNIETPPVKSTNDLALVSMLTGLGGWGVILLWICSLGSPFGLILADVDHFKWINDTHGHAAGDRVVTGIGKLLQSTVRPHDFVSRFGGDEFAILLANVDADVAQKVGERIREAVERSNFASGDQNACLAVTFSMGLAVPLVDESPESLLKRADQALYLSKQQGRNQLHLAEASLANC